MHLTEINLHLYKGRHLFDCVCLQTEAICLHLSTAKWLFACICLLTLNVVTELMWGCWIGIIRLHSGSPMFMTESSTDERVQIDWQWPLSCVHSIMMVNSAHTGEGEGGGCTLSLLHSIYHHEQSCGARFSWEGRYIPLVSPPAYSPLWSHLGQACFTGRQLKTSTELQNIIEGFTLHVLTYHFR